MPFSTPPAPSEPPNSRILTPLTGIANRPLADAKAMAGLIRAGSFSAPRFGLPLRVAGAPCRVAVAAAFAALFKSCSILAIRPCRLSTCLDSAMARAPSASMSFSIELCFRCRSSTRAASRVCVPPGFVGAAQKPIALRGDGLAKRNQFAEVAGQFLRPCPQFGHHGAEQHGGAKRLQRVFRPYQQGRRRAPSRALQGSQHLDNLGTARIKRTANLLLARIQRAQPRFGIAYAGLDPAHLGCDVDHLLIELTAVLADRRDLGLELRLRFRRTFLLRAGGFEFLLALLDGVGGSGAA